MTTRVGNLAEVRSSYEVLLSDVWGVVHNGVNAHPRACQALAAAREAGLLVVLITNSPRRWMSVVAQMRSLGVPDETYDRIVTSGDVTRHLIEEGPKRIFFIGAERELELFADLDVELVGEDEAEVVVCTSPFNDEVEGPDDYRDLLGRLRQRNLPFVCANPDMVVERGHRLVYCAGALAKAYADLGGRTLIAGKPHPPIYEAALAEMADAGRNVEKQSILAIGDGLLTDVRGAQDFGVDLLYVANGIHASHYTSATGDVDPDRMQAYLDEHGAKPKFWIPDLV